MFDETNFPFSHPQPSPTVSSHSIPLVNDCSWEYPVCKTTHSICVESGGVPLNDNTMSPQGSSLPIDCEPDLVHSGPNVLALEQCITKLPLSRGQCARKPPAHLYDYVCHTAQVLHPSPSHPSIGSSGTWFLLANYVTCHNFSPSHSKFLATITTRVEPQSFNEVVQDPHWRQAM